MPTLPLSADAVRRTRLPLERATQLPAAAFTDPDVLAWEIEEVFQRSWICAGHVDQVDERGSFVMTEIGSESILVVGDDQGIPRAFINSCRHRGSRIVDTPEGSVPRLQCPYHGWSYDFDGMLKNAPFTEELEDFDGGCFGLKPVRLAVIEGLVLLDVSGEAPSPAEHVGELATHLARCRSGELRRARRTTYEVAANWKAIAGLSEAEERRIVYFLLFPNTLVSLHPDYVMLHTLWPREPNRTDVVCEWFFEPATMRAAGFDASDAIGFCDQVNREDWNVCRLAQLGMSSRQYEPGRYTSREGDAHAFDVMVADRYLAALSAAPAR